MSRAPVVTNRIPIGDERRRERTVMVRGYDSTSTTYDELFAHFAQVGSVAPKISATTTAATTRLSTTSTRTPPSARLPV